MQRGKKCREEDMVLRVVDWADLLPDLLRKIGQRLETEIEIRRFRSVCSSWRYSRPPLEKKLHFPLKLPHLSHLLCKLASAKLSESTFYILESPEIESSSRYVRKSWLLKLEQSNDGTMRALNPFSNSPMPEITVSLPKVMNLLNIRVTELGKVYTIECVNLDGFKFYARKVLVMSSNSKCEFIVWVVDGMGRLGYYKSGDPNWTWHDLVISCCDLIRFKGRYYAVDSQANGVIFDEDLNPSCIPKPASASWGLKKYLLESGGKLFLVILIRNERDDHSMDQLRIYKLNMKDLKWEELKSLDNQLLFLGVDCSFMVPAANFTWGGGSWVFMVDGDVFGGLLGRGIGECKDLGGGRLSPLPLIPYPQYGTIFWPPPSWIAQA